MSGICLIYRCIDLNVSPSEHGVPGEVQQFEAVDDALPHAHLSCETDRIESEYNYDIIFKQ